MMTYRFSYFVCLAQYDEKAPQKDGGDDGTTTRMYLTWPSHRLRDEQHGEFYVVRILL